MKKAKKIAGKKNTRVPYALAVYGKEEINAVVEVLKNPLKISPGEKVAKFGRAVAKIFGKKCGVMVNSGSSANLIALEVLELPEGAEVITPALTFGTTLAPILQKRLRPVFVDVDEGTYLASIDAVEQAITTKTRALMIPSLLGNIPNMERLAFLAKKYKLFFIEDSADTLGATYKKKPTGHYSHISTTSFYASHIITAGASGGMVMFHDEKLARRAEVFSAWGRQSTIFGSHEKSENIRKRFSGKLDGETYDAKFIFTEVGYNFQSTEMAAAFGLVQLTRLGKFTKLRQQRFQELYDFFSGYEKFFVLPRQSQYAFTNWLAFPLTIKAAAPFGRNEFTRYLELHGIQTRPIFTGNVLRQPGYKRLLKQGKPDMYPVTDNIMHNGFVLGAHHGLTDEQMKHLKEMVRRFINARLR